VSGYLEEILAILAINTILAYGAFLPMAAGQLNLGVAGFMAIGAYGSGFLNTEFGIPVVFAALMGGALAGVVGVVVGFPVLRTRGMYLALATFALGEVVRGTILNMEVVGAAEGYAVDGYVGIGTLWLFAAAVFVFVGFLFATRFALCIKSVQDDETVADLFGINVKWTQLAAFTIGAFLAGIGGALYGHRFTFIEAQYFSVILSIYIVLYVLFGGFLTVIGPLVGATFFTFLPEILRATNEWRFVIFSIAIILLMVWRPWGLISKEMIDRLLGKGRGWGKKAKHEG
jgi:branched-chain amino acid transport system permease protein